VESFNQGWAESTARPIKQMERSMRNSRRIVVGFIMALVLSGTALSADTGAPGGAKRGTCGFLEGLLYKVGNPAIVSAVFERVFGCDFGE
jgi:hypothetical protein